MSETQSVCKHCQQEIVPCDLPTKCSCKGYYHRNGGHYCVRNGDCTNFVAEPASTGEPPDIETWAKKMYADYYHIDASDWEGVSEATKQGWLNISASDLANEIHQHFPPDNPNEYENVAPQLVSGEDEALSVSVDAPEWRKLPVGHWFFLDSLVCTHRYSVQERTDSGCTLVCSTPWHHDGAKADMQRIADLHNSYLSGDAPKVEEIASLTAELIKLLDGPPSLCNYCGHSFPKGPIIYGGQNHCPLSPNGFHGFTVTIGGPDNRPHIISDFLRSHGVGSPPYFPPASQTPRNVQEIACNMAQELLTETRARHKVEWCWPGLVHVSDKIEKAIKLATPASTARTDGPNFATNETEQRQIDIINLRLYARLAEENEWKDDVLHWSVFKQTLEAIATRLERLPLPAAPGSVGKE